MLEDRIVEYSFQEAKVIAEANNFIFSEGLLHELNGFLPVLTIGDEFCNHGVIESRDCIVLSDTSFDSDTLILGWFFEVFKGATAW